MLCYFSNWITERDRAVLSTISLIFTVLQTDGRRLFRITAATCDRWIDLANRWMHIKEDRTSLASASAGAITLCTHRHATPRLARTSGTLRRFWLHPRARRRFRAGSN